MKNKKLLVFGFVLALMMYTQTGLASTDACTYAASVNTWGSCQNGLSYATSINWATTTSVVAGSAACEALNVTTVSSCSYACDYTNTTYLSWPAVNGLSGFKIYKNSETGPFSQVGSTTNFYASADSSASDTFKVRGFTSTETTYGPDVTPTMTANMNPGDTDVTPIMTANVTGSSTASANSEYANRYAYYAFDNSFGQESLWENTTLLPALLKLDYGAGNSKKIIKYSVFVHPTYSAVAPKSWTFQGSDNGIDWTTLDTQTNVTWSGVAKAFTFANDTSYRSYRLNITTAYDNRGYVLINELQMFELLEEAETTYTNYLDVIKTFVASCNSGTCYNSTFATTTRSLTQIFGLNMPGLVAYYPFDTNANDAKGGFHLTNNNSVTFTADSVSANLGKSAYFDGVNDSLSRSTVNDQITGMPAGNYSVCTWYKQTDYSSSVMQELVSGRESTYTWSGFELQTDKNNNNLRAEGLFKSPIPAYGNWNHVCYTKQGANSNFYLNGDVVNSSTASSLGVNPFPEMISVGKDTVYGATWEYFKGNMDDLAIWSRGLSACEVKSLYVGRNTCLPPCTTSCYATTDEPLPISELFGVDYSGLAAYLPLKPVGTSKECPNWGSCSDQKGISVATYLTNWEAMLSESEPGTVFGGSKNFSKSVNTAGNEMTYPQQQFTGFPESSFSISFWMSPNHDITPTSVSQSPYSKGGRPFGVRQKFEALFPTDATDAGKFQIDAANDSDASAPGGHLQSDRTSWGAGEWYHVTLVNNYASSSDGLRLYIDGVLEDTKPRVNMPILPLDYVYGQNFFRIGGSFSSPNRGAYDNNVGDLDIFDGKLADFAIWTKALSECEVKQMAKGPNACSTPCSTCYSPTDIVKPLGMTLELSDPTLDTYLEVNNNLINSGNGFNSSTRTYTGGTSLAYSTGVNNANSLSFDKAIYPNSTAYVRSSAGANDFGVNVPDNGTVSMWIKMSALNSTWSGSSPRIFGANNQNECFINWGGNRIQCDLGSAGTLRSPNDLEANKWYHLAVTWDTTSATKIKKMWLNGELVSTSTSTTKPFAGSNMWIGHSAGVNDLGSNNGQPFNGSIDDIALYRRALSDCEIMKLAKGPNACSEPCITCASPDNKFKVTQTSATYANMDALCKSEYGNNWEFATLDNADENYIMTANAGVPMFPVGTYAIKNTPSDTRPFYDNGSGDPSTNNVCLDERNDPAWPETDKMALFELDTPITGTMPFCYADMPKTNSILGVCRNTTFDSLPACTGSLTASCQPTPSTVTTGTTVNWTTNVSGALGPVTYSWLGTGLTGKTTQVATTSYSSAGVYRATTTVSDTVSSLTVACAAPVSVSPIRYGICPPPPLTYQSRPTSGVCSDSVSIGAVEGDEAGPWRWTCFGSDTTVSTDDDICPAQMAVDFDCSVSMVDQKDRVAVGTNTQWKINGGEDIPSFYKRIWMIAEGDGSYIDVPEQDNNTLNYPFTIVGPKKVRVRFVSKSNPLDVHSCDDNRPAGTTAVLTGGLIEL